MKKHNRRFFFLAKIGVVIMELRVFDQGPFKTFSSAVKFYFGLSSLTFRSKNLNWILRKIIHRETNLLIKSFYVETCILYISKCVFFFKKKLYLQIALYISKPKLLIIWTDILKYRYE